MKLVTLLPADQYVVVNKTILTEIDKKNLLNLYEPIIGFGAVSLYLTLWSDLDRLEIMSRDFTHHHLMSILKCSLEGIKQAREALEAVGLMKTYYKEGDINSYVYELYSPLSASEFFNNPILNIVLYHNVGEEEYNYLKKVEIFIANIDSEAQGKIELILKNSKGKEIFHKKVKASDVPAGEFFSYSVNRRIQPGERYELYISYTGEKGVSGFPQLMVSERSHNLIETEEMLMDGQVSMEYNVAITYHYAQINPFRL